jgi:drug/metabolite transporter (DMT)-like permease
LVAWSTVRRLILLACIWGWSFLFIKVVLEGAPPPFLAWGRIALGLAVLIVFLRRGGERPPERRYWGHLAVLGLTMSVLPFLLIGWGEQHITSALTAVLNACTPLFAAAFAAWLLAERLRWPQLAGLVLGFVGVAVAAGGGGGDLGGSSLAGVLAVVLATAGYGFGFAYAHRFTEGLSAPQLSLGQLAPFSAHGALCLLSGVPQDRQVRVCAGRRLHVRKAQLAAGTVLLAPFATADVAGGRVDLHPAGVLCLLLLGMLGTGYAYLLNYRTLQESGATVASLVTYLVPIVGVAAGVLVLGEPFSVRLVLGGLVVVGGVALVQGRLLGARRPEPAGAGRVPEAAARD